MVHDEEYKVAAGALDPYTEPRPHAGVLFEADDTNPSTRESDALSLPTAPSARRLEPQYASVGFVRADIKVTVRRRPHVANTPV